MMEIKRVNITSAEGCIISPYASLENVVLGRGVVVRDGVQLKNVTAGDGTRFSRNATFYSADAGRPVRIGRDCWFSYGVLGEATGGQIIIGDYVVIAHGSAILTSSGPGSCSPVMNLLYPVEEAAIEVRAHCWIGAHCVVLPGVSFGQGVMLGANSLAVRGNFDPWSVYGGNPATLRKRMDPARVDAALKQWRDRPAAPGETL